MRQSKPTDAVSVGCSHVNGCPDVVLKKERRKLFPPPLVFPCTAGSSMPVRAEKSDLAKSAGVTRAVAMA
ncbi:hypothetical protein J6590_011410 [Homalodisca vitripennis]|nr:hypothetical protein J6590_011410 [Homalodisca vitripennis]